MPPLANDGKCVRRFVPPLADDGKCGINHKMEKDLAEIGNYEVV